MSGHSTSTRQRPSGSRPTRRRVRSPSSTRLTRASANTVGALGAGYFAWAGYRHYVDTHSLIGAAFLAEQSWVVVAYLARRRASTITTRTPDWIVAFGGTFGGVLYRPVGAHPPWGVVAGGWLQAIGLVVCCGAFVSLGRSFGVAAADRGLKTRGPYALVRHPLYASYFLLQGGYVLQSQSWRNVLVMAAVCACNVARVRAEERVLVRRPAYLDYCASVRWRFVPGVW